jgi:hypothetical protein
VKNLLKTIIKQHHVIGKEQMKQAGYIAQQVKNDSQRRGGFSASQWVIGKHPRRPGSQAEEDEWGQLGTLQAQQDAGTEFGIRAKMRFTAQKAFVRLDCGRRYAASMLRKARPLNRNYQVGDFVMYKCKQGAEAPGDEWSGPARIIGFESDVVWLQHMAVPICTAVHLLRPASTAEMLACQVKSRNATPKVTVPMETQEQEGFLDMRHIPEAETADPQLKEQAPAATISTDESVSEESGDSDEEVQSKTEEKVKIPRPLEDHAHEVIQETKKKKPRKTIVREPIQVSDRSPIERLLDDLGIGTEDPGRKLAKKLTERLGSAASSSKSKETPPTKFKETKKQKAKQRHKTRASDESNRSLKQLHS